MSIPTVQDYLNLITSAHAKQPNFVATVNISVSCSVQIQNLLNSMLDLFDLDTPPVGNQLDIIGQIAGASRDVEVVTAQVGFSWDYSNLSLGWDAGSWVENPEDDNVLILPDDVYLILIRAVIGANYWDGTTTSAYAIYNAAFAPYIILISDHGDMTYDIAIIGGVIPALTFALLASGYIPLKPEGVKVGSYYQSTDNNPAFAWDFDSEYCGGWDTSSWLLQTLNLNVPA